MGFNKEYFIDYFDEEDIDICKYIFYATEKYNFSNEDVVGTTRSYINLLIANDLYEPEKVVEDEELLDMAVDNYLKEKEETEESVHQEYDEDSRNESYVERTKSDEKMHALNGYGQSELYDDVSFEDIENYRSR